MEEPEAGRGQRLPPGPHGLSPELVARNQRERLVAAMAEVCAEEGYAAATVAGVARRAGVSTASFYRQFKDRRECILASFEELLERFLGEVERACAAEEDPAEKVRAAVGIAATLLAADPPTARLLTVEIVAVGPEGVRLQQRAIERMAERLRVARGPSASPPDAFPSSEWVAVAAMAGLVARRAAESESPDPAELQAVCAFLDR